MSVLQRGVRLVEVSIKRESTVVHYNRVVLLKGGGCKVRCHFIRAVNKGWEPEILLTITV